MRWPAPNTIGLFVVGLVPGRLPLRFGSRNLLIVGAGTSACGYLLAALMHSAEGYIVASGVNVNIRTIGGAVGTALMATVVNAGAYASGIPRESGYTYGFAVLGCVVAISAIAAALIPARRSGLTQQADQFAVVHSAMSHRR